MTEGGWFTRELKGRHVLMVLCGFFGVMFIVNGFFVYFALSTFSGGDTSDPYRKGLHYNEMLAADERQAERGLADGGRPMTPRRTASRELTDKAAEPVSGLMSRSCSAGRRRARTTATSASRKSRMAFMPPMSGSLRGSGCSPWPHARRMRGGEARSG